MISVYLKRLFDLYDQRPVFIDTWDRFEENACEASFRAENVEAAKDTLVRPQREYT